eukprot:2445451-Prymnesium_polylepis.1
MKEDEGDVQKFASSQVCKLVSVCERMYVVRRCDAKRMGVGEVCKVGVEKCARLDSLSNSASVRREVSQFWKEGSHNRGQVVTLSFLVSA